LTTRLKVWRSTTELDGLYIFLCPEYRFKQGIEGKLVKCSSQSIKSRRDLNNINLKFESTHFNMDSDEEEDRNFARQGGEALDLEGDFDSEEEVDEDEEDEELPQPQTTAA
jgi:hypothetical protein